MAAVMLASASGPLLTSCHEALTCLGLRGLEEFPCQPAYDEAPCMLDYVVEDIEKPLVSVDALMTTDTEVTPIPRA